jgi:hypothetical protein
MGIYVELPKHTTLGADFDVRVTVKGASSLDSCDVRVFHVDGIDAEMSFARPLDASRGLFRAEVRTPSHVEGSKLGLWVRAKCGEREARAGTSDSPLFVMVR